MKKNGIDDIAEAIKAIEIMKSNLSLLHQGNKMFLENELTIKEKTIFGIWYYNNTDLYSGYKSFRKIDSYFENYYNLCKTYMSKYNEPTKKSFFANNKAKKMNELADILSLVNNKSIALIELIEFFQSELIENYKDVEKVKETIVEGKVGVDKLNNSVKPIDYEIELFNELAKVKRKLENEHKNEIEKLKKKSIINKKNTKKDGLDDERRRILG